MDSTPIVSSLSNQVNPSTLKPMKNFYLGEPLALGITQILIGIMGIVFGIMMDIAIPYASHSDYFRQKTPYWTGILYIISGSVSVKASKTPKMPWVKGMLVMNVVSTVAAAAGIVIASISFIFYYLRPRGPIRNGIQTVLFIFTIVEFCITISTAAFGCRTVCRDTYAETIVVVYQNMTPDNAVSQPAACKDPETA
ncbi:membrane-spanning 4-domains subfamily A member 15-like [Elgaria multicarinata webbii]|uniref:membrane-spanning 4-domains subfamily A member 15-like n=1 Tax=Elgaria multicarinata webbii TaxID=159646 RepID=UPI002FCCDE4C